MENLVARFSIERLFQEKIIMYKKLNKPIISDTIYDGKKIAVLIPCHNEEVTIKKVINDFQEQLPKAVIYVYDNNSSDNTSVIARTEGAAVIHEKRQGKRLCYGFYV